ncbi:MAG: lysophospholipid acyltransferase family protein [Opitutales bacterium]|nr:lysophospholipid acyltransferase family protein [Opitutales bacterium]
MKTPLSQEESPKVSVAPGTKRSRKQVKKVVGWRGWLLRPLWWGIRLWLSTVRFRVSRETLDLIRTLPVPVVVLFWHQHLFSASYLYRRHWKGRKMCGLISASRDGAWLDAFYALAGIRAVRGSSSFRGGEAIREMISLSRQGYDIAITPDGPRGPKYSFKNGAAMVVEKSNASVLLVHYNYHRFWRLRSWDGFFLPRPFSRVEVRAKIIQAGELPEGMAAKGTCLKDELMSLRKNSL